MLLAKPKKRNQSKRINDLDRLYREIFWKIFNRDSCYTCDKTNVALFWGHFVSRGSKLVRWDINNSRPQCFDCNNGKQGNIKEFRKRLIAEVGLEEVERIESLKGKPIYKGFIDDEEERIKGLK